MSSCGGSKSARVSVSLLCSGMVAGRAGKDGVYMMKGLAHLGRAADTYPSIYPRHSDHEKSFSYF